MRVIEIDELRKDFVTGFLRRRVTRALDDLSLEVSKGEVFGFLGPNGAGKTTTFRILLGLLTPTSGNASILGKPIGNREVRAHIGYLAEQPRFYDHLTAGEFLVYCGRLAGMSAPDAAAGASRLLERFGLSGSSDRPLRQLSKGQLQRIGLAQALIHDPDILFLDEPMSGLDPLGRSEVRDLIISLRNDGKTIFFSSHILSDIQAMCDRVAIINRGRLVEYGRLADILNDEGGGLEAVIAGIGQEVVLELRRLGFDVNSTPSGARALLPNDGNLEKLVEVVHRHSGRVVSVNPVRESLEDLFVRSVSDRSV